MSVPLVELVRERGPLTVAAFMDLSLYHPTAGYYARVARRSGRAGDFFTSVDVGTIFGELLAAQIADMARHLPPSIPFDLVEAGAGDGRLAADVLRAIGQRDHAMFERTRLHLVESSAAARASHAETLGPLLTRKSSSTPSLPETFTGVLLANELFDAFPVHHVVMRGDTLQEAYVVADGDHLATVEAPVSSPALHAYFSDLGIALEDGWSADVSLASRDWMAEAATRLHRGFMILIDYGFPAHELYSAAHATGTLTAFSRHTMAGPEHAGTPAWLRHSGEQDVTAHVDFTTLERVATDAGLVSLGLLDQTYFLLGLLDEVTLDPGTTREAVQRRLALKTLLLPGGLGSTMKVMILAKGVGQPSLKGCSYRVRRT